MKNKNELNLFKFVEEKLKQIKRLKQQGEETKGIREII